METGQYRAAAGEMFAVGETPQEALQALLTRFSAFPDLPIMIWPYQKGDADFTEAQWARLQDLKSRRNQLTASEWEELESLVEAEFDAAAVRSAKILLS